MTILIKLVISFLVLITGAYVLSIFEILPGDVYRKLEKIWQKIEMPLTCIAIMIALILILITVWRV